MKITRRISETTTIEAEGATVAELFEALSHLEEVFLGHETCGLCGKTGVKYNCRQDKEGNKYYQCVCLACGGEFRFGVRRSPEGCLFPQLKDAKGNWKPDKGWAKWQKDKQAAPQQQESQQNSGRTEDNLKDIVAHWKEIMAWLNGKDQPAEKTLADLNALVTDSFSRLRTEEEQRVVWPILVEFAKSRKLSWDRTSGAFKVYS